MEGLPISLLEGMSYGKVCTASDITANKEALGDSGIWVKKEKCRRYNLCPRPFIY